MTDPTPPAVSEALREAVAQRLCCFFHGLADWSVLPAKVRAEWFAHADRFIAGPIASEIARLTEERDAAREEVETVKQWAGEREGWPSLKVKCDALVRAAEEAHADCEAAEAETARLRAALERAETPRPISEYHEDMGFCLWWILPVCEPPYSGSPLCDDWPEYHTHFTPLPKIRDAAWREAALTSQEKTDA